MNEFDSIDSARYELVEKIVRSMYDQLVQKVIADVKALPDSCRQSGDDSNLEDVWEEFKFQFQQEQSVFFAFYEDTVRELCVDVVAKLDRSGRELLWLWTDGFIDCWADQDEVSLDDFFDDHLVKELYNRVCDMANAEPLLADLEEEDELDEDVDLFGEEEDPPANDGSISGQTP